MSDATRAEIARFLSHVDRRADDECWPWTGTTRKGYGRFRIRGSLVTAHRWAYETFVEPIPDDLTIDHVWANGCERKDCVNWLRHLEPVTNIENLHRSNGWGALNARKTHCDNGHEFTPENTYFRPDGGRKCRKCRVEIEARTRLNRIPKDGPNADRDRAIIAAFAAGSTRKHLAAEHGLTKTRICYIINAAIANGLCEQRFDPPPRRRSAA